MRRSGVSPCDTSCRLGAVYWNQVTVLDAAQADTGPWSAPLRISAGYTGGMVARRRGR